MATRVSLVIDGPGIIGSLSTVQSFSTGTSSTTFEMGLPVGGPYRIRAKAYDGTSNGNMLLRSGKAAGIMITVGSAVANIVLADVAVTLDPITPGSGDLGSAVQIRFDISDPGDVVEGMYPSLYGGVQPFSIRGSGTYFASATVVQIGEGSYQATFSVNLPAVGSVFYYGMAMILPFESNIYAALYSPNPNVTATPWSLALTAGSVIQLTVANIPAAATMVAISVDGTGIAGTLSTQQRFSPGTSSSTLTIGVPVGGPYRIRAKAYDASANGNPILRSGKVSGVLVSAGSTAASIGLADIAVSLDAATPISALLGSSVTIQFQISDPGDVIEGTVPALNGGTQPFSIRGGGTIFGTAPVTSVAPGQYLATFTVNVPAAGSVFYYSMNLVLPWDGNIYASLYSPNPNVTATPWLLSLTAGTAIQLTVTNIPATATRVSVTVDGAGMNGTLSTVQSFPAGTASTGVTIGVPAGGPYRVRAKAYDGTSNGNSVLRSGKATGILVAGGSTAASIGLADISVTLDPAAPASAQLGSAVTIQFHISDPGDVVEGMFPSLYGGQQPFSIRSGGTAWASTSVVPIAAGYYLATFSLSLPVTGSAFYYAMNLPFPRDGDVYATLYSPDPGASASPWEIALGISCNFILSPANRSFGPAAASGTFSVTASRSDCPWNSRSSDSWILVTSVQNSGSGSASFSIAANTSIGVRSGVVSVGNQQFAITQAAQDPPVLLIYCSHTGNFAQGQNGAAYSVTVSNGAAAGPTSGMVSVTETLPAGMSLISMAGSGWTCAAGSPTCTRSDVINGGASYPPITVMVNVAANAPAQVVNQVSVSGGGSASANALDTTTIAFVCSYALSPTNPTVVPTGGSGSIAVITSAGCAWSATSNTAWISIVSGNAGSGSGTIGYNAGPNTSGGQRSGTLTIAGQPVTVTQGGNNLSLIPALVSLSPFQGAGPNAALTLVYGHPSGWAALRSVEFIVNPRWEPNSRGGGCYVKYAPGTGLFTLIADDGNNIAGTGAPGSGPILSNSQCVLNTAASSVTGSGTNLSVVAALTFQASFAGQRHIWMQAVDYNNLSTNWLVYGVWFPTQTSVTVGPWYRIYDPYSNSYLYSADQNEYDTLGTLGFTLQGVSGLVMHGSTTVGGISNMAWYRVYVNVTKSHLWTSDRNEFLTLINAQDAYVGEGVAAFVMPYINAQGQVSPQVTNTIPFYRAAFQGANLHFWTPDRDEFFGTNGKHLPQGYFGEGIACYIFPPSGAQFGSASLMSAHELPPAQADDGAPSVISVVNSASHASGGAVAPGQVLSIYGRHLGGSVLLNGVRAEVILAEDNEIRVVAPGDLGGAAKISLEVEHRGRRSKPVTLDLVPANPAIFGTNEYGRGIAHARNHNGTRNDEQHRAQRGSLVTLDATGWDLADLPAEVHIGGRPADVISARASATRGGVIELQVRVPEALEPSAFQPVILHVGNLFSQPGIGLAIQ